MGNFIEPCHLMEGEVMSAELSIPKDVLNPYSSPSKGRETRLDSQSKAALSGLACCLTPACIEAPKVFQENKEHPAFNFPRSDSARDCFVENGDDVELVDDLLAREVSTLVMDEYVGGGYINTSPRGMKNAATAATAAADPRQRAMNAAGTDVRTLGKINWMTYEPTTPEVNCSLDCSLDVPPFQCTRTAKLTPRDFNNETITLTSHDTYLSPDIIYHPPAAGSSSHVNPPARLPNAYGGSPNPRNTSHAYTTTNLKLSLPSKVGNAYVVRSSEPMSESQWPIPPNQRHFPIYSSLFEEPSTIMTPTTQRKKEEEEAYESMITKHLLSGTISTTSFEDESSPLLK